MPELKHIRALVAVSHGEASGALGAYFRARGDRLDVVPQELHGTLAARIRESDPDFAVLELGDDMGLLAELRREFRRLPIVVLTKSSADVAFHAARLGAAEMLALPLDEFAMAKKLDALLDTMLDTMPVTSAAENTAAVDGAALSPYEETLRDFPGLFSHSPRMLEIRDTIDKVATTSATVLIRGESGVGKEIVARMVYARSARCHQPFIKVNCAAIPNELLESELFGYEPGAFTGATRSKPGKFELADSGTLFLDEIGEMHPQLQAKLLHVLQDGEFSRLGAKHDVAVDVRLICATNQMLEHRVSEGLFREDLFYRINVVTVHVPPLRERRDEIPRLLDYFLTKYSEVYGRTVEPLDSQVMRYLTDYSWPGNIRELENLCKRYVIVGNATQILRELAAHQEGRQGERPEGKTDSRSQPMVPEFPAKEPPSLIEIGRRAAWEAERQAIQETLLATKWNRREAARRLRVSYKALLNKIRQMESEGATLFEQSNT